MVKSILKVLKKNQIHLKKAVVCVVAMALILQSLVYYGQNYTLDAKATENQRGNMTATTSGDAKTIPLNSSGTDSPPEDGLEADSAQGDSSGTDSSTGTAEGSATENSTGTGNDSVENQDATTSGDAKADDSETDATPEDDSDGKLDNLMTEITNSLLEMAAFNVNSNYVYLNPTGMNLGGINWSTVSNVYITATGWSTPAAGTKDANGYWYWDVSSFGSTSNAFCFTLSNNWSTIKSYDYYRTDMSTISLASAKGKIFTHDGTAANKIDSKYVYAIKEFTSLEGQTINFVDYTQLHSKVTAIFSDDNTFASSATTYKEIEVTSSTNVFSFTIPGEQKYVKFVDAKGNQLGDAYNFYGQASTGEHGIMFVEGTTDTYYYKVTEKANDDSISTWGALPPNKKLKNTTLYFDTTDFAEKPTFIVDGTTVELENSGNGKWVYKFPEDSTATQRTMLTVLKDGVKYHFLWSDTVNSNVVKIQSDIANVTGKYIPARTVYFDATLSKLPYSDSSNRCIPSTSGTIRYYATNSSTGATKEGAMDKAEDYTENGHTWSDVYIVELDAGYDKIVFSNFDMNSATNYGGYGDSTTTLEIPLALDEPCFYADSGDKSVYETTLGGRDGYWDSVHTPRDAEAGKSTTGSTVDVVDIKKSTFTHDTKKLYVNSTFYDYYTDYEMNGYNRDSYPYASNNTSEPFPSQRNWVPFRLFNQALSDYYESNNASIPIYTGHFQTDGTSVSYPFSAVASSLNLFGYGVKGTANYNKFFSTNNSALDVDGKTAYGTVALYDYAAQGLVSAELSNDSLMLETTEDGTVINSPHFDEEFLKGNNSKNTVLGDVYHNVSFPFEQIERTDSSGNGTGVKYWTFDSANTTLAMRQDKSTNAYYLQDVVEENASVDREWSGNVNSGSNQYAGSISTAYGFFPFNETSTDIRANTYNYGYGAKLEFQFKLTPEGTVLDKNGDQVPITFEFSGDDDVWVFIDGKLVLDIGGAHGQVTGSIDFSDASQQTSNDDTEVRMITATVSNVKASAGSTETGSPRVTYHKLNESTGKEHTLTMFYMERGMWESNMKISFNFPDENQLEVEKQVDTSDVNEELFSGLFDDISLFEYKILNQATHYEAYTSSEQTNMPQKTVFNDSFTNGTVEPSVSNNVFKYVSTKAGQTDVVHWWSEYSDLTPKPGAYRAYRYGIIAPAGENVQYDEESKKNYVDISQMRYLEFKFYCDNSKDKPSMGNMYLQLVDTEGNIKGNLTDFLSADMLYGMADWQPQTWVTVKINLSKLKEYDANGTLLSSTDDGATFNNKVAYIKFGYNYPEHFYLDDFVFHPIISVEPNSGFTTKQYNIPDYGSATSGELEIPEGAVYSSSTGAQQAIGQDGTFYLKDGETITFKDQFRRGSYIYLAEKDNPLFETSWTMYENGQAVSEYDTTNTSSTESVKYDFTGIENEDDLRNVTKSAVDDGRIEPYLTGSVNGTGVDDDGNTVTVQYKIENDGYITPARPTGEDGNRIPTFVFSSYEYPNDSAVTTKLKIVYTNKVKVGSLTIKKEPKYESENLTGTYEIKVVFSNIGGIAVGDGEVEHTVSLKAGESITIEGIPLGTFYTIEEVTPTDGSFLDSVEMVDPNNGSMVEKGTNIVKGVVLEQDSQSDIPVATFKNTMEPKISVSMTKNWMDEVTGDKMTTGLPSSITIQLQRKVTGEADDQYQPVDGYESIEITSSADANAKGVWNYTISGLDKLKDYDKYAMDGPEWVYRFVELKETKDADGNVTERTVLEDGNVITLSSTSAGSDDYKVTYEESTKDENTGNYSSTITNTKLGANLKVIKQSSNTNQDRLAGVTFTLEKGTKAEDGTITWESLIDGEKTTSAVTTVDGKQTGGEAEFTKLEDGIYRLTETKTAEGHTLLKEPIIITINRKTGEYTWRMESVAEENADDATAYWSATDRTLTLTVTNSTNIVLPLTGGYSPIPIMAGGMALSMAASLLYIDKKKRRRKEGKPPGT